MSVKKKLIKNTIVNYSIRFWGFILTFILFWFIVKKIGEEDYGIYLFVSAITGYFGILNLGLGGSLVKFVAQYQAEDDKDKVNEVINTTFFMFLVIGAVGGVLLFLIGTFLLSSTARAIIYILGVNFIFTLSMGSLKGVLAGLQRYDILALITFIMSLINLCVIVLVLSLNGNIIDLVFYTTCTGLLGFIMTGWYIQRLLPYVSLSINNLNWKMVRILFDLSISVFLLSVFLSLIYYTDRLVIGLLMGVTFITFYQAAWKLRAIPSRIPEIGIYAIIPAASELETAQNFQALRELFLRGTKYVLALCLALAVPVMFLSREMLTLWMGDDYAKYYIVVQILTISLFFDFNNYVATQILIGMNKIKKFVKYYGVVAVLNLGLSIYLVQEGFGLTGVALGTTIPFVLFEVFFLRHVFNVLGIDWRTYLRDVFAKTFPYAGAVAVLMYVVLLWHTPVVAPADTLIELLIEFVTKIGPYFVLGCGVYMLLFYLNGLEPYEKEDIKKVIAKFRVRTKLTDR